MAEWASLKPKHGLRKDKIALEGYLIWQFFLGGLVARGSILDLYPFGVAFGAALLLNSGRGMLLGLSGVVLGVMSMLLADLTSTLQTLLVLAVLILAVPALRGKKWEGVYLGVITALTSGVVSFIVLSFSHPNLDMAMKALLLSLLSGALAVIFWFALQNQEALRRGNFTREQGTAWLALLIGTLSGLHGVKVGEINFETMLLSFFILFVAERFGAGSAAGVGLMLGFMTNLQGNDQNLMNAGIYGLVGFGSGALQKLGKLGIGISFSELILMLTIVLHPAVIGTQLISSGLGLLLFMIFPSSPPKTDF